MDAELSLGICPGWDKGLYRKGRALAGLKVKIKLLSNLNNPHMSCLICCVFLILRADSCATVSFVTKHSLTKVATYFSNQWETLKRDIKLSAGHREVSLVLTCWCSCSRLCSGTYWMWPVSGCNVYSSGYSDFDNVALFAASLQLLHRFTLFSSKTNSAQFNSVFRVFHYVVIPGTRNFF